MMKLVQHRVAAPRVLRLIQKWLKAGVLEEGQWSETEVGTPQGSGMMLRTNKPYPEVVRIESSSRVPLAG
jgi:RNA-directed DNA polymerase